MISCGPMITILNIRREIRAVLVGNWRAFEFQGGAFDMEKLADEYDLVTALDPNSADSLVIDNLYNSGVRVKSRVSGILFSMCRMAGNLR